MEIVKLQIKDGSGKGGLSRRVLVCQNTIEGRAKLEQLKKKKKEMK